MTDRPVLYERAGLEGRCPSPICWRARIALAQKGIDHERIQVTFADVGKLQDATGAREVPVLKLTGELVVGSDDIAAALDRLDDSQRLRSPSSDALLMSCQGDLMDRIDALVAPDVLKLLAPGDSEIYQTSREARFGHRFVELEEMRNVIELDLAFALGRLEKDLGDRASFGANGPDWGDIAIYCHLLWIAVASSRSWPQLPGNIEAWWEARDAEWRGICLATP
ncbi:MAG: glutathione S-transferase N-terminal domain-containing protein [Alphaproteobacteria bacterium]|nr:glutathione S-transferase N-terminal domain-containing protein [Alphaproteobacteria bacterium]